MSTMDLISLQGQHSVLQQEYADIQQQFADANDEIESLEQKLTKAKKELRTLRASGGRSVSTTQTPQSPAESEALKREAALQSEIEDLKAKLQTFTKKDTQEDPLKREIETLHEANILRAETARLRKENGDLHQKVNGLEAESKNSTSDFQNHIEAMTRSNERREIYDASAREFLDKAYQRFSRDYLTYQAQYPGRQTNLPTS